ncbi:MAG TPA: peptidyl-prolyl cis-trans isomerase [Candidatus Polarisedimenticolia bacterium]|nr:peptidyl-prolyl cis-trans isomerase [Candidatus Polarisedimenticolia bacterium]
MKIRKQGRQENGRVFVARALLLACASILGCTSHKDDSTAGASTSPGASRAQAMLDAQVVATVGGEPIPMKAFERYLADNSGDSEDEEAEQTNAIRSRLLDQMIEEQLLMRQAKGLGVTVSEAEVDDYLAQIGVSEGEAEVAGGEGKEAFRDKVRQGLILQKVKDKAVMSKVEVTPGEVEDYLKKQPEAARVPRSVVLRQILIDDKSLAERLAAQLAKEPARFEALARENSVAPDKGQARAYTEEQLPVELREALFQLEPGRASGVLENSGRYLIFQLVRKMEPMDADLSEVKHRLQLELFRKKGEQALERYIADLKKDTEVHVNRAVLPFEYSGEYRN